LASCITSPSSPMLARPRGVMRIESGPASSSRRHTGIEAPAGTSSTNPSRRPLRGSRQQHELGISECHGIILVRFATASRRHHRSPATGPTAGGADPRSAACALQGPNSHALFAAEIQYFVRENMALSAVSAVVSSSWLLRAAAFQKAPFKMTCVGSNPPCPASQCGLHYALSACSLIPGVGSSSP
jgi:hypothetical protein